MIKQCKWLSLDHTMIEQCKWLGLNHTMIKQCKWLSLNYTMIEQCKWLSLDHTMIEQCKWLSLNHTMIKQYKLLNLAEDFILNIHHMLTPAIFIGSIDYCLFLFWVKSQTFEISDTEHNWSYLLACQGELPPNTVACKFRRCNLAGVQPFWEGMLWHLCVSLCRIKL